MGNMHYISDQRYPFRLDWHSSRISRRLHCEVIKYRTEEKVHGRFGGVIYESESPIKFALPYVLVGLLLAAFAVISVFGCMGRLGR
jgi:hypothetical protein